MWQQRLQSRFDTAKLYSDRFCECSEPDHRINLGDDLNPASIDDYRAFDSRRTILRRSRSAPS